VPPGGSLLVGIGGPGWCALVKDNVTIVLHSADNSAVTFRSGRVGLPDRLSVLVAKNRTLVSHNKTRLKYNTLYRYKGSK
jgi:hypothetical protein